MLHYDKVSGILQDKIDDYQRKEGRLDSANAEFYALCIENLSAALDNLNDTAYFNRQIIEPEYQDNPDAALTDPDMYLTQDDLQAAMDTVEEINKMEYRRMMSQQGAIVIAGTLILGLFVGFIFGRQKRKNDGAE